MCGLMDPDNIDEDWDQLPLPTVIGISFPVLFVILFMGLTGTVFILITKLKIIENKKLASNDVNADYFRNEIQTLTIILVVFSMSYLLRTVFDIFYGFAHNDKTFSSYMIYAYTGVLFDLLPIFIVLIYHRKNLTKFQHGKD